MNRLDNRSVVKQGFELNPKASAASRTFASDAAFNKRTFQTALQNSQQRQAPTRKADKSALVANTAKKDIVKPLQSAQKQTEQTLDKVEQALDQIEQDNANTVADTTAQTEQTNQDGDEVVAVEDMPAAQQTATSEQTAMAETLSALQSLLADIQTLISQVDNQKSAEQPTDNLPQLQLEVHALAVKQIQHTLFSESANADISIKEMPAEQLTQFKDLLMTLNAELQKLSATPKQAQLKSLNGMLQSLQGQIVSAINKVDSAASKSEPTQASESLTADSAVALKQPIVKTDQANLQDSAQQEQQANPKEQDKTVNRINTAVKSSDTKFDVPVAQDKAANINIDQLAKANDKIGDMRALTRTSVFEQVKEAIVKQSISVSDHSEMVIKLKPEELGKVELKIEVHNENVIAKFNVASQMVKEAIESNLADLKNSLKDKGFSEMAFDVNVQKDNSNREHAQHGQGHRRRTVVTTVDRELTSDTYIKTLSGMLNETTFEHLA